MFSLNMKTLNCAKLFVFITLSSLLVLSYVSLKRNSQQALLLENNLDILSETLRLKQTEDKKNYGDDPEEKIEDIKYILLWTNPRASPFVYMGEGRQGFIDNGCPYTNCYSTGNRNYLSDVTKFDVVAFNGAQVYLLRNELLPKTRSPHQKYVFGTIESAGNYPICDDRFNGFFNWTWTYKISSDSRWGYVVVRDKEQKIIGPNVEMHWMKKEDMDPVSEEFKNQLRSKTAAAAWFVSNCRSRSKRENFNKDLMNELKAYNLTVDVYGQCGPLKCDRNKHDDCTDMVKKKYYFYLAFENSFSEDYVTEKLLHALQNDAIPIVYGGANYTRFMPDGIYLNARELGPKALAKKMNDLINNPDEYAEYFRWKNHYSFYRRMQNVETNEYCGFCAMLNNQTLVSTKTVYEDFKKWWMADECQK